MRLLKRPWLVLAIAVAIVALPTAASGALSAPKATAAGSQTYQDSTGENPAAPDITTITVSNDDAATITFKVNSPNRPQYASDIGVYMFIDSDANQATGDVQSFGADHVIQLLQGETLLFKWDGSNYTLSATQSSLNQSWASGPTIRINASDLNNTRRLAFGVIAESGVTVDPATGELDFENTEGDIAPTIGFYRYNVVVKKPTLVVRSLTPTPARPIAGRPFTLKLVAARSDTGARVQNGRVSCVGRVGAARLTAQLQRVQGGAATCTWSIPPNAKGKTFRGSVTVSFEGLRAGQSYSGKVR